MLGAQASFKHLIVDSVMKSQLLENMVNARYRMQLHVYVCACTFAPFHNSFVIKGSGKVALPANHIKPIETLGIES